MPSIDHALGPDDAPALHALYETYGWWDDRDTDDVRQALVDTDEAVGLRDADSGSLVAAARVLTDYTYYAMVFDVIVDADRRGEGLGRTLLEAVAEHPALDDVTPTLLAREGLVDFYETCGFVETEPVAHPDGDPEDLRFLAHRDDV